MEKKNSLKKDTFAGFLWLFVGSGFQSIIKIIVLSILARLVLPYEFGVIGAALIIIGFSRIFSQMGMGPAIIQRPEINQSHIRTGYTSSLLLGAIFAFLLFLSAPIFSNFFGMPELTAVLKVVALIFIIDSFIVVSQSLIQRKLKLKVYALVELSSYIVGYGTVAIIFAYFEYGIWALVYGNLGRAIMQAFLTSYLEPHSIIPYWNHKAFKELFYFGGGFTIAKIANYFALQGDNIVVGKWLSAADLGYYSRAYQLMVMPVNLIGSALDKALFPAMASVQHDKVKLQKAYLRSVELVALISLPVSVILFINAHEIVLILLGENWIEVIIPLKILSVGMLFRVSYKISDSLTRATGAVYKRAWRQIVYAISIFIGAFIGQKYSTINGVATGVLGAIILNFYLMAHLSIKELNLKWSAFFKSHISSIVTSLIIGSFAYFLLRYIRSITEHLIIIEIFFLACTSLISLLWLFAMKKYLSIDNELTQIFFEIKKRVLWKK